MQTSETVSDFLFDGRHKFCNQANDKRWAVQAREKTVNRGFEGILMMQKKIKKSLA